MALYDWDPLDGMLAQCCQAPRSLLPGCLCPPGCDCMCLECGCEEWGEEYVPGAFC